MNIKKYDVERFILDNTDVSIIYLYRGNLLKRYISLLNMRTKGVVHTSSKNHQFEKITVNVTDMMECLEIYSRNKQYESELMSKLSHPVLNLNYDDCFESPETLQHMLNSVFDFLQVNKLSLISQHKKILPRSLMQLIDNFACVENALKNTEFEVYLE